MILDVETRVRMIANKLPSAQCPILLRPANINNQHW